MTSAMRRFRRPILLGGVSQIGFYGPPRTYSGNGDLPLLRQLTTCRGSRNPAPLLPDLIAQNGRWLQGGQALIDGACACPGRSSRMLPPRSRTDCEPRGAAARPGCGADGQPSGDRARAVRHRPRRRGGRAAEHRRSLMRPWPRCAPTPAASPCSPPGITARGSMRCVPQVSSRARHFIGCDAPRPGWQRFSRIRRGADAGTRRRWR